MSHSTFFICIHYNHFKQRDLNFSSLFIECVGLLDTTTGNRDTSIEKSLNKIYFYLLSEIVKTLLSISAVINENSC